MEAEDILQARLIDALDGPDCAICSLLQDQEGRFIDSLLYDLVNDAEVRGRIMSSLGFCDYHAWKINKHGDVFSSSIIYEGILNRLAEQLREIETGYLKIREFQEIPCPICQNLTASEGRYVMAFISNLSKENFYQIYINSFGLCLRHLRLFLHLCRDKKMRNRVLSVEVEKIESLLLDLKELHRKYDYRFSSQPVGKEADSWIRAVKKVNGVRR